MSDPKSLHAGDFINHEEVEETLAYAEKNKNNVELIDQIIEKAKLVIEDKVWLHGKTYVGIFVLNKRPRLSTIECKDWVVEERSAANIILPQSKYNG